jgi:hypothetical protein
MTLPCFATKSARLLRAGGRLCVNNHNRATRVMVVVMAFAGAVVLRKQRKPR